MAGVKKIKEGAADVEEGSRHMTKTRKTMEKAGNETPWRDLSSAERVKQVLWVLMRLVILLACLYFFICSLGLLEDSFQLVGGKAAGKTFQNNDLITNPIAGLMIGVLATVLVQSSSTSTSIIITMVGTKILNIRFAIPIIMGANIGTSVTNTLVSLAQVSDRIEFRRAFAGATVHDMFNWLSVLVLLPLEVLTHYLERLTQLIVDAIPTPDKGEKGPDMLKAITKPFTKLIVEVNKKVIQQTAAGNDTSKDVGDVLLRWCDTRDVTKNVTHHNHVNLTLHCDDILQTPTSPLFDVCREARENHKFLDLSNIAVDINYDSQDEEIVTEKITRCENLFAQTDLSDSVTGGILLVSSLIIIFVALYGIVKGLHSLLHGSVTKVIRTKINSDLPGKFAYFTGYIALLVGAGMTMILQSSSVFTSTLTPLVGVGVVTVDRMYPLTLGANIGTTVTGILAALSQDPDDFKDAMHVALCHLFFNIWPRSSVASRPSIAVLPQPPEPMTATSGGRQVPQQVIDSTEVAYTCIANVGNFPPARITWFVSNSKTSPGKSVTSKAANADQRLKPWDLECSVRRISVLRLSLTCQELGKRVYVRCHVDHPNKTITRCENPQQDFCRWSPPVDIKGCDLEVMSTVAPDNGGSGATPHSPGDNEVGEGGARVEYDDEYGQDGDSRASPAPRDNTKHDKTTAVTDSWTLTLALVIVGAVLGTAVAVILVSLLVRHAQRAMRPAGGAPDSLVQQGVYTVLLQLQDDARTQYSGRTGEGGGSGGSQHTDSTEDTASVGTADTESVITDDTASDVDSNVNSVR